MRLSKFSLAFRQSLRYFPIIFFGILFKIDLKIIFIHVEQKNGSRSFFCYFIDKFSIGGATKDSNTASSKSSLMAIRSCLLR